MNWSYVNEALGRVLARRSGASPMGTMSVSATGGIASSGPVSDAESDPQADMARARMVAQSAARVTMWGAAMGIGGGISLGC